MAALATISDYVDDARTLLQDKISPYRYTDPELLVAFNVCLLEGRRLRPDLFLGDGTTTTLSDVGSFSLVDGSAVSIEQGFRLAFLFGLCAHAMLRDAEEVQDARANAWMAAFRSTLVEG